MSSKIIPWLFFSCFFSGTIYAQQGAYQRINNVPVFQNGNWLKNPWAGGLNHPLFSEIDLNGDGLKDLFAFDRPYGRIECFINQGTTDSVNYTFSSSYFSHFPYLHDWVLLRDYNCDGKEDIFAFSDDFNGIKVYKNTSSGGNLQFQPVSSSLMMLKNAQTVEIPSNSIIYPAIVDVDNDNDLDILNLTGPPTRLVEYYKNLSEENGHGCDSLEFQFETGCWGNFTFDVTNEVKSFNTPCREAEYSGADQMVYDPTSAARRDDSLTSIFAFDENGDGAKDLLIGDLASTNSLLVINGGTPDAANMVSQDTLFPSYDTSVDLPEFANHAYIDVDNDGKKDMLVSNYFQNDANCILFYKNDSTTAAPRFSYRTNSFLQDQMIDVGEGSFPVFFDYDGDGLTDIVIGNYWYSSPPQNAMVTSLWLYKNIGTSTSPAFELETNDLANISQLNGLAYPIYPAFGDMDGDGRADLVLGCGDGKLIYFKNTSPSGPANFVLTTINYFGIHVGQDATPQVIDLDQDGLPDLVIGSRNGYLKYYRNTGTKSAPSFSSTPTIDSLGKANTAYDVTYGYSVPFIYKDSVGKYEMFLAGGQGYVFHYTNIDDNPNSVFTLTDTLINLSEGQMLSVSGADINNDGKIDLIVGNYSGGAGIFSQYLPVSVPPVVELSPSFELFPNPAANMLTVHVYNLRESDATLRIFDMLGRNVKNMPVSSTAVNLDISYIPDGIYIVELQSAKFYETKKLIIRH